MRLTRQRLTDRQAETDWVEKSLQCFFSKVKTPVPYWGLTIKGLLQREEKSSIDFSCPRAKASKGPKSVSVSLTHFLLWSRCCFLKDSKEEKSFFFRRNWDLNSKLAAFTKITAHKFSCSRVFATWSVRTKGKKRRLKTAKWTSLFGWGWL